MLLALSSRYEYTICAVVCSWYTSCQPPIQQSPNDVITPPLTSLRQEYRVEVPEHSPPRVVAEVLAADPDGRGNGPPFSFRMDPAAEDSIRRSFRVEQDMGM